MFDRQAYLTNHAFLSDLYGWSPAPLDDDTRTLADELVAGRPRSIPCHRMIRNPIRMGVSAWVGTGDDRYAEATLGEYHKEVIENFESMLATSSLAQAGKCNEWLEQLAWMLDSPRFTDPVCDDLLDHIVRVLDRLLQTICPASMNWRIADAESLLNNALLLDFVPRSRDWLAGAVRALNDAFHRQVNPDGSHCERNPHYHIWMTQIYSRLWDLSQARPQLGLHIDPHRVAAMWDFALFCNRPNGTENGIHDSRGLFEGGIEDPERLHRAAFLKRASLSCDMPPVNGWFPDAGLALLRDSWDTDATYVTFDATQWGESHCHYSRNCIQVHAQGRTLLCDPGIITYANTPFGNYSRSTRAHSTLSLNGWNQCQTNPSRTRYAHAEGYDLVHSDFEATYHPGMMSMCNSAGLGPGLWASHHRLLLWIHARAMVVIDSFVRAPGMDEVNSFDRPFLESNWQLTPGEVSLDTESRRLVTRHDDANLLMCFPALPDGVDLTLHTGEENPPRGWISTMHWEAGRPIVNAGIPTPAPQLSLRLDPMQGLRAEYLTVLVPFAGREAPDIRTRGIPATLRDPGYLTMEWDDGSSDEIIWTYRLDHGLGRLAAIDTDASLVHCRKNEVGDVRQGVAFFATHCAPYREDRKPTPQTLPWKDA